MRLRRFVLAAALLLAALAAGTLIPRSPEAAAAGEPKTRRILVLSNPIHTDIALPLDAALLRRFGDLARHGLPMEVAGARYLVFGWGGRSFYVETPTWSDLKPLPLLKGLTIDQAAMHVAVAGEIADPQDGVVPVMIGEAGYDRLLAFIEASFARGPEGPILIPNAGYGRFDAFFEAPGTFTALVGCNTWTSAALRAAGLRTGWWTPLPQLLGASLRLHNTLP